MASPLEVPELILELYLNTTSREQYPLADVVLKMDLQNYSIMDFQKSPEIYALAADDKDRMRGELLKVKEMLSEGSEVSHNAGMRKYGSYYDLAEIIPTELTIIGALPRDIYYIERYFNRRIRGKPLDSIVIENFLQSVYKTGNYRITGLRTDTREGRSGLELLLYPVKKESTVFLLGGHYEGTLSRDSISKVSLQGGVQFFGLSGSGSVLFFNGSIMDVLSFRIFYLQPITPFSFISAQTQIVKDRDIIVSGFSFSDAAEKNYTYASGEIRGGFHTEYHSAKAGPFFLTLNHNEATGEDKWNSAAGFGASYSFSSLDYPLLPSRGFNIALDNNLYIPLSFENPFFFNLLSLEMQAALPLGKGFSLITGLYAGSDLGPEVMKEFSPVTFNAFDRHYFPNISGKGYFLPKKAASSIAFQYQPWKNLIILGGQLIFSVSASAGELLDKWNDFTFENLIWNASFNTGLRLKNNYGLLFRAGAGKNGQDQSSPFISFDIGRQTR